MSKEYAEEMKKKKKINMRVWSQRPGSKNKDGSIKYFTEQHHKDTCDINKVIQKYDKTGVITHVQKIEAKFGNLTGDNLKDMMDQVHNAVDMFNQLPSEIRTRFDNHPAELVRFMENPENRAEAIKLGIIKESWTEETDGLGEHVKLGENINKETGEQDPVKTE